MVTNTEENSVQQVYGSATTNKEYAGCLSELHKSVGVNSHCRCH